MLLDCPDYSQSAHEVKSEGLSAPFSPFSRPALHHPPCRWGFLQHELDCRRFCDNWAERGLMGRLFRDIMHMAENSPLRRFGISHFIVARKR